MPEDSLVKELDKRIGQMEEDINTYERNIVQLGFMEF
jgi:hypothetical protein